MGFQWDAWQGVYQTTDTSSPAEIAGTMVGRIEDQSGNSLPGLQATAGLRPTVQIVGGYRVLRFDHTDDALAVMLAGGQTGTMIAAGRLGTWVETVTNAAGALTFGGAARTIPGSAVAGILRAVGDVVGIFYISRALAPDEEARVLAYYQAHGALGKLAEGPDIVDNGDFAADATWVKGAGVSIGGGVMTFAAVAQNAGAQEDGRALTFGGFHIVRAQVPSLTGGSFKVNLEFGPSAVLAAGPNTLAASAGGTAGVVGAGRVAINANVASTSGTVDDVSVRPLLPGYSTEVAAYGDSLTGAATVSAISTNLGRVVHNRGLGGQYSGHIATRQSGRVLTVTVAGNQIVAGANSVTHFNGAAVVGMASMPSAAQPLSTPSVNTTMNAMVTIAGISGRLVRTASGGPPSTSETYTFTPSAGQSLPAACPADTPMTIWHQGDVGRINVFWAGRNDNWATPDTTLANIASMVATVRAAGHSRFLVMSILNGSSANEAMGQSRYVQLRAINDALAAAYPSNFFDMRRYLIDSGLAAAGITPTSQDLTDIANDIVPASLRVDPIHLTAAGYGLVGQQVAAFIAGRGW